MPGLVGKEGCSRIESCPFARWHFSRNLRVCGGPRLLSPAPNKPRDVGNVCANCQLLSNRDVPGLVGEGGVLADGTVSVCKSALLAQPETLTAISSAL